MPRCLKVQFGPDGLARDRAEYDAPAVGEGLDEEEPAPRYGVRGRGLATRKVVTACVRHLDPEYVGGGVEGEAEVPAGESAMGRGVRGEFGDDVFGGVHDAVRQVPRAQPLHGEEAGEASAAWGGRQEDAEVTGGGVELGGLFLVHVTECGGMCLP